MRLGFCDSDTSPFSTLKDGGRGARSTWPRAFFLPLPVSKNRSYIVFGGVLAHCAWFGEHEQYGRLVSVQGRAAVALLLPNARNQ